MTEQEKRKYRCCFTGHRPEKLTKSESVVKADLEREIRKAIADGMNVFISGMARGVDLWAADIVLRLRDGGEPIKLICASPFEGFERSWNFDSQQLYADIMRRADLVRFICSGYSRYCFQIRNEWMVDRAARVIAVFNGKPSGTKNTINYANKVGVPICVIDG